MIVSHQSSVLFVSSCILMNLCLNCFTLLFLCHRPLGCMFRFQML
uniref:Uncharacterized protein n=1 Tax=Anguilla anguilla TaxID=7936 RepID=A0A0E9PH75_ANGAN